MDGLERQRAEIIVEALRQSDSCLYTSTSIYMWLRPVKLQHKAVIALPIFFSGLAGLGWLAKEIGPLTVAIISFLATLIPALAEALEIQTHVSDLKTAAANYKSLQDRFRQLARIDAHGDVEAARARLAELMDRMDAVRESSITPPEKYFTLAQEKIKAGHYDFSIDIALREAASKGLIEPMPVQR